MLERQAVANGTRLWQLLVDIGHSFFSIHEDGLRLRRGLVLAALILQGHAGLDGRVVRMPLEGAAGGVESLVVDDLALKRLRGLEL